MLLPICFPSEDHDYKNHHDHVHDNYQQIYPSSIRFPCVSSDDDSRDYHDDDDGDDDRPAHPSTPAEFGTRLSRRRRSRHRPRRRRPIYPSSFRGPSATTDRPTHLPQRIVGPVRFSGDDPGTGRDDDARFAPDLFQQLSVPIDFFGWILRRPKIAQDDTKRTIESPESSNVPP